MSTQTKNYGLVKPDADEFYNVADQNGNMNILDTALKKAADAGLAAGEAAGELRTALTQETKERRAAVSGESSARSEADTEIRNQLTAVNTQLSVVETDAIRAYDPARTYALNDLAVDGGAIYKSLQDSNAGHVVTDPAWWVQYGGSVDVDPEQIVNYTMLYYCGDECGETTGGWGEDNTFPGYTRGVITKTCNRLICVSSGLNKVAAVNTGLIDLEEYANVRTIWSAVGSRAEITPSLQINNSTNCLDKLTSIRGVQNTPKSMAVLPIPANTGQKYIFVLSNTGGGSSDNGVTTVFVCWLDKPDNYTRLLAAVYIANTYPTPAALVADTTAMTAILSSPKTVRLLTLTCTGDLMVAILQSPAWIKAIKANETARRIIMANPHWAKFIAVIPTATPLLNYTMLYDQGDECESVTGGWGIGQLYHVGTVTFEKNADHMRLYASIGSIRYNTFTKASTTNTVDFAEYDRLGMIADLTNDYNDYAMLMTAKQRAGDSAVQLNLVTLTGVTKNNVLFDLAMQNKTAGQYVSIEVFAYNAGTSIMLAKHIWLLKTDPYQPWLDAAGITKTYANLEAVLADQTALRTLMTAEEAVDYLSTCTGTLMFAVLNNTSAVNAVKSSTYAAATLTAHAAWKKFIDIMPAAIAAGLNLIQEVRR